MLNSDEIIIELTDQDSIPIAGQLSRAIQAGLPLESGLRALAEQTRSSSARRALIRLSDHLEQGMPLDEALRTSGGGLPRQMRALVEAGLESGRLDAVMRYCIEQLQRSTSLRQHLWLSLSYPLFLIWFAALICGLIVTIIVPSLAKLLTDFNTEVPTLTRGVLEFSSLMLLIGIEPWLILMLGVPLLYLTMVCFGVSIWGHRLTTSIPFVGRVFRFAALTDYCQILATMVDSGLSFSKAIRFAGEASDDRWLNRQSQMVAFDIDQGTPPSNAASLAGLPNSLCQVLRETGSRQTCADGLRALSDIYAAQCHVSSRLATSVIAQFSVTFVVIFVSVVVLSLFIPLIKLLNDLA